MPLQGTITISRTSNDRIIVAIHDVASVTRFVEVSMTPEAFGYAVTGLGMQPCDVTVSGLANVGKRRVSEPRSAVAPNGHSREFYQRWLAEHAAEAGWMIDAYLGSQGSIVASGDTTILNYRVVRYEETE